MENRPISIPAFIEPCLATAAKRPPVDPHWVHVVKQDGYRLMVGLISILLLLASISFGVRHEGQGRGRLA